MIDLFGKIETTREETLSTAEAPAPSRAGAGLSASGWDLEALVETLLENSGDIILVSDRGGRSIIYNDAYAKLIKDGLGLEMKPGLIPHRTLEDPREVAYWSDLHRRVLSGEKFRIEFSRRFLSGEVRRFDALFTPLVKNGVVAGFAEFVKEITESRKTEEALSLSREKFRRLFENLPDGFASFDLHGTIKEYNPAFKEMLAYSDRELTALSYRDITPPRWLPLDREKIYEQVMVRGYSDVYQKEYIAKDGRLVPVELRVFLYRDSDGRPDGYWAFVRDATERKKYEDALLKSEEKYRLLVNHAPAGIYEVDFQIPRILSVNDVMCEYTGYSRQEFLTMDPLVLLTPESRDLFITRLGKMAAGEKVSEAVEYSIIGKNGTRFDVLVNVRTIMEDGRPRTGTVVAHNITELRKAEKEKENLEAQLRQAQKMEAIGVLASGVAHDFNNILQTVSGNVQLISSLEGVGDKARKYLGSIENAVERAADLVRRLLTFGRKVEPDSAPMDLKTELNQAVGTLRRVIPKMITIDLDLPEDLFWIKADANQFHQILMNLGANARDAMPQGGRLVFQARNAILDEEFCRKNISLRPGEFVRLVVSDTGQGMDGETLKNIFHPFFTTKDLGRGAGLGLAIVYGIVKSHGAAISCESEPGRGTSFTLYWPAGRPEETALPREEQNTERFWGGSEKILVVDDEPDILDAAAEYLVELGYAALKAGSGEEALEIFREQHRRIDLILLDLGMPGIGGFNALLEMLKIFPPAKIVITSGYSGEKMAQEAMAAGATGFLPKPYRLRDLAKKIRLALGGAAP
ncbi:MAG: PAS domain S-box protein [Pseudomonadota bacterium]